MIVQVTVSDEKSTTLTLSPDQHLFLRSTVAKLKTSLQLSHLQGRRVGLSRQQIDNYIINSMFDNLSGTQSLLQLQFLLHMYITIGSLLSTVNHTASSCHHYIIDYNVFMHPPLHDTEKVINQLQMFSILFIEPVVCKCYECTAMSHYHMKNRV